MNQEPEYADQVKRRAAWLGRHPGDTIMKETAWPCYWVATRAGQMLVRGNELEIVMDKLERDHDHGTQDTR